MTPWTEKIYDMSPAEIIEYKSAFQSEYMNTLAKETNRVPLDAFYIEYRYYQVRKDYKWVQEQLNQTGDKMTMRREILLERMRGSDKSPFDQEDIQYLIDNCQHSQTDLIINNKWVFKLYNHGQHPKPIYQNRILDPDLPYLVGIDPASGEGGDNFAITIINPYNLQIAAEFKSKYIGQTEAIKMLVTLINDYIPNAILCIEQNSIGKFLIQYIVDQTDIVGNLYWSQKSAQKQLDELTEETPLENTLKAQSIKYKKYGTYMTHQVRESMLEILFNHVRECRDIVNTEYVVDDICKLERNPKTKKVAAVQGEHDDSLFSYLHAMYIYYNGDNLEYFGINREMHPLFGNIQDETELSVLREQENGWFNVDGLSGLEDISSDKYAMQCIAYQEEIIKDMVTRLPNIVYDDTYSNVESINKNSYDNTYSIPSYFFDQMNGF